MPVRALMIDVDGVLVEGRPQDGRAWHASMEADLGLPPEALHEHFFGPFWESIVTGGTDMMESLTAVLQRIAPHLSAERLVRYWFERDARLNAPLLSELAQARRNGVRVYLATNQEHLRAKHLMDRMELRRHVDGIFYSANVQAKKPDPLFFKRVEAAAGLACADLLLLDDSPANIDAARRLGWQAILWTGHASLAEMHRHLAGAVEPGGTSLHTA